MCRFPTQRLFLAMVVIVVASSQAAADEKLEYKLRAGQAFAYSVKIEWTDSNRQHRLTGKPYYQVHHKNGSKAVMMVVGRLRYESNNGRGWRRNSSHDYWFGTDLTIDERADRVDAMIGRGGDICPESVAGYVCDLIFPELPYHDSDTLKGGETSKLMELNFGSQAHGKSRVRTGQSKRRTKARPIGAELVQLETNNQYITADKTLQSFYQGRATFDKQIGALLEHKVISKENDSGDKYEVFLRAHRIRSAEGLAAAKAQANQDYAQLPAELAPVRFTRKRIKTVRLPQGYTMDRLPKKGTVAAYYDSKYDETYAVQYVEAVGDYEVLIRFVGSGETREIHVGNMRYPNRSRLTQR
jgi:hypothetical protein